MVSRKKTRSELAAEVRMLRRTDSVNGWASVLRAGIKWGAVTIIAVKAMPVAERFAGDTTLVDLSLRFVSEIGINVPLAWATAIGGVGYGLRQRSLRRDAIERLSSRNAKLERHQDPRRSSSNLTSRGDTNPRDRE